jgi:hypothetical protein
MTRTCSDHGSLKVVDEGPLEILLGVDGVRLEALEPSERCVLETEVALITHLKVDLYLGTPTHSIVDSFIISNYLVPFGPIWLQGRPSSSRVAEPTYR